MHGPPPSQSGHQGQCVAHSGSSLRQGVIPTLYPSFGTVRGVPPTCLQRFPQFRHRDRLSVPMQARLCGASGARLLSSGKGVQCPHPMPALLRLLCTSVCCLACVLPFCHRAIASPWPTGLHSAPSSPLVLLLLPSSFPAQHGHCIPDGRALWSLCLSGTTGASAWSRGCSQIACTPFPAPVGRVWPGAPSLRNMGFEGERGRWSNRIVYRGAQGKGAGWLVIFRRLVGVDLQR